jgi:ubiquinone/menaquinone biosynthesis C-methylase UbiE
MTLEGSQKDHFLHGEGDSWFQRNRTALAALSSWRAQFVAHVASQLPAGKPRVLEIGCGEGSNLAALGERCPIDAHGIEPSAQAVDTGRATHAGLDLRCGTADSLPYEDASFDLVWFGFCLYLVDRSLLFRCVSEADRVLRNGGTLAIVDFDPHVPMRRAYHHKPGLWSYKMDHSRLFLANPAYRLVEKVSASHAGPGWVQDPNERLALWICRKDAENAYVAG